jgi:hypothetical protein
MYDVQRPRRLDRNITAAGAQRDRRNAQIKPAIALINAASAEIVSGCIEEAFVD